MRNSINTAFAALLIMALAPVDALAATPLEDGVAAYNRSDYGTAARLLRPLADKEDPVAQRIFGQLRQFGMGVPQDSADAVTWYRKAAEHGDITARVLLGRAYLFGNGVPRDTAEAVKWLGLAAEQGDNNAASLLGGTYEAGTLLPQDYAQAVKWLGLAAGRGDADSQEYLGTMYEEGTGVPQDYVQAHKWYTLAIAGSSNEQLKDLAFRDRDRVTAKMTLAQIAEGQRLAREWAMEHQGKQ